MHPPMAGAASSIWSVSAMAPRNSKERLVDCMTELRKHLVRCYECRAALKDRDPHGMCRDGALFTVGAAREFNHVLSMRRQAYSNGESLIHACPDLSAHGMAYQMSAPLFTVIAIQEELF